MLRQLRESSKTILWIVVATFVIAIFAVWGMDLRGPEKRLQDRDVIGSIDKDVVRNEQYQAALNQLFAQLRQERGENYAPSETEVRILSDQAWEMLVQERLMAREIEKLRITVTDDELVAFLRKNPHPSLQRVFVTADSSFDYQAYLRALGDPNVDWTELEKWGRSVIPQVKLQAYLAAQVHVPERELLDRFEKQTVQVKARYVEIPFAPENPPYEPKDSEIDSAYAALASEYLEPEMRAVRIIEIPKKPSAVDEQEIFDRLNDLRTDILGGRDFAEAARDNSEDQITAEKGGDLGFFAKGDMPNPLDSIVWSLKPGEISKPVRTEYGWDIVQALERKTEKGVQKTSARHILMKVEPGYDTIDSIGAILRDVGAEIKDKGFEKTAADRALKIIEPEPFAKGMFVKDVGFVPRIVSFAFNYGEGEVSSPIETGSALYFVKIVRVIPEKTRPLSDVRTQIVERIRTARQKTAALARAASLRAAALREGGLDAAARGAGLAVRETPLFAVDDAIPGIGGGTDFARASHELDVNQLGPPIRSGNSYFIILVTERTKTDMDRYGQERGALLGAARNDIASRFMALWYEQIREKASVIDLRERTLE